jgi:type II restriction enzyme
MLKGNKGEWSEVYVLLKLLSEGKLNAADKNLEILTDIFYPVLNILRKESNIEIDYSYSPKEIKIISGLNSEIVLSIPTIKFLEMAEIVLDGIKSNSDSSFEIEIAKEFLQTIQVNNLKAKSTDKSDLNIIVHDLNTGLKPKLGFSIKSLLGGSSTLLNAGQTTNFIYEIKNLADGYIDEINQIEGRSKIRDRITRIKELGGTLNYLKVESENFEINLKMIDSNLPFILSEMVLAKYAGDAKSGLVDLLAFINEKNPLKINLAKGHPFYTYKIKAFLTDSALGMTPAAIWKGNYDATGGIIIVKENGEVVCYHIYNRTEFQEYLITQTMLETASSERYGFGKIYLNEGRLEIKLNLQVRFK